MSSSPYQILENRPIDQWRVTELKEELKKRKLPIKGLKEDLVKRLDEAVRIERASAQQESDNNDLQSDSPPLVVEEIVQPPQQAVNSDVVENSEAVDAGLGQVVGIDGVKPFGQEILEEDYVLVSKSTTVVEETVVHDTPVDPTVSVTESVVAEVLETEQGFPSTEIQGENGNSETELVSEKEKDSDDSKTQLGNNEYSKPASEEVMYDAKIQVYEVSANNLGSPVKCDSISTDCVSINEKIEIKDNIIADNVKLELLDNIKPEMVAPSSSSTVVPVGGESHPRPMDVEEPHLSYTSVEDINDTKADLDKKFDSMVDDAGYSEKLNLDRSSGDDSMEEDVLESKQVESKYRSDDLGDGSEKIEVSDAMVEGDRENIVGNDDIRTAKKIGDVSNDRSFAAAEKRKFNDQALAGNNEPLKRQRRWNTESLKVPEPQSSNLLSPTTTPKEAFQSAASKGLSKVDTNNDEDALKERIVPPSPKAPTNSLRIDRFVRPFTLKAVQELLGKTGSVTSFWMDHIKTHCYVTYSSVEEAMETRNAVYNLQWPPNGGRLLLAEFVDPQEVKTRLEAPPTPVGSAVPVPAVPPTPPGVSQPQPSPRLPRQQQQLAGPPQSLPPPPPLSNPPQARERLPLPPPLPLVEKVEPPIVTLDDLFRKTKATPRIYYLPLSEEQVAAKLAAQGKSAK